MPKNMKYDATAKKAAGPKKKMKSNQDGGSVTAKDPAAAGRELVANQKGAARYSKGPAMGHKKGPAMGHKKGPAKYDRVVLGGNTGDVSKTKPGEKDYDGGAKMGYSQKFGAGRMNGYQAGAKRVMDVMTYGAGKYMADGTPKMHNTPGGAKMMEDGPAQKKNDIKGGERISVKTSDGKMLDVKRGSGFHQQAVEQGSVLQVMRPSYPMGDPYEKGISQAEKDKRKKVTYPK